MASGFDSTGGGTSGGFQGGGFVDQILQLLGGLSQQAGGQYMNFVQNPTRSPLYQNQLSGLLRSLEPSENRAQTNLMDTFRNAGNMSSGAMGVASGNLQGELVRNRQVLASQLLGQMFPQMIAALQGPMSQASGLVGALKNPSQGADQSNPWAGVPPSQGLGTPMNSGNSQNPYEALIAAMQQQQPYETAWSGGMGGFDQYGKQFTPPVA